MKICSFDLPQKIDAYLKPTCLQNVISLFEMLFKRALFVTHCDIFSCPVENFKSSLEGSQKGNNQDYIISASAIYLKGSLSSSLCCPY